MNIPKASTLRSFSVWFFLIVAAAGLAFHTGNGTLSAIGYRSISAICPLGSLEAMIASRTFLPAALISLAVVAALAVLAGRFFCAWICPVPSVRVWFVGPEKTKSNGSATVSGSTNGSASTNGNSAASSEDTALVSIATADDIRRSELHSCGVSRLKLDSRHYVLGGALLSTAIFGFPVFCLICPIGLTFASLIAVWRLFQFNEPSWSLAIFPAILVLELVVCRKWCRKLCPLGALLSLLSTLNLPWRPRVNSSSCLRISKGVDCTICKTVCAEEIDLHHASASEPLSECTKCRACSDACPAQAITFPFKSSEKPAAREESAEQVTATGD